MEKEMTRIVRAHDGKISSDDVASVSDLLRQLNPTLPPVSLDRLNDAASGHNVLLFARNTNGIIGMATLVTYHKLAAGKVGIIEDVVVDEKHLRKGVGEKLMRELITIGKRSGVSKIHLTSNERRVAAHHLYKKMGFKIYNTCVFRLSLS